MRLAVILSIFVLMSTFSAAQENAPFQVRVTAGFSEDDLAFGKVLQYDTVALRGGACLHEPGWPMLPARSIRVALPAGMRATRVRVEQAAIEAIAGEFTIFPTQPPQRISAARHGGLTQPDAAAYGSESPFPANLAELAGQTDLAGQGIAIVRLHPVQYVPARKALSLCAAMTIVVEGTGGYVCGDYLSENIRPAARQACADMVREMVVNPGDVALQPGGRVSSGGRGLPFGAYDYVIVTQESWVGAFQPLADWKTQKGVPTNIVTTAWIYNDGGYSGSDQAKIRAFVQDAYTSWGTMYFLLGGDTDTVPCHVKNVSGDDIPNDTYYGDYDGDWACEVHVGRAPVRDAGQIAAFIDKVLTYEQSPPLTDYARTAALFGFDLYCSGSEEGEGCKQDIDSMYIPSGWTMRTEYDSESGAHKADVIAFLNQGSNLINHIDHCNWDRMGAGYTNHGELLENPDMDALVNGDRQSIFYSIGCWPCAFDYDTCIAECFVNNMNGGGAGFVGNTRYGWYSPFSDNYYSLEYDRCFFASLFNQGHFRLGECFSDHKNDGYDSNGTYQYIFTELTLLGDPEMNVWTEDPAALAASFDGLISMGSQSYTVNVKSGGSNFEDAVVCLWKGSEVYAVALTDGEGNADFVINPATGGDMLVTVTARNRLPFVGSCTVSNVLPAIPDIKVNGADWPITVDTSDPVTVTIALDPGEMGGEPADWWVYAQKGYSGTWWRRYTGGWTKSAAPIRFAGATIRSVNEYVVLDAKTLPGGFYDWTFSIDEKNGVKEDTFTDTVHVTVIH